MIIAAKIEQYLGRALTDDELYRSEELNLNYYTHAVLNYVDGLIKRQSPKDFDLVYQAIIGGVLTGAYRRKDIIFIRDRFEKVYKRIHAFVGDGMSNGELEAVIFLAEDCTDKEIDAALAVARLRGVHHAKYVRAVIEGNRRAVSNKKTVNVFKPHIPEQYEEYRKINVPRVDAIRESWKYRLSVAKNKVKLAEAELNARSKTRGR